METVEELKAQIAAMQKAGKSAILKSLGLQEGYSLVYVDAPDMDLGDIAMPIIDQWDKR